MYKENAYNTWRLKLSYVCIILFFVEQKSISYVFFASEQNKLVDYIFIQN